MSHSDFAAELDMKNAWHGDRADPRCLSGYDGRSTAWLACEHARLHGHGNADRLSKILVRGSRADSIAAMSRLHGASVDEANARRAARGATIPTARPKNSWKRGVPRSAASKTKQTAAMHAYYHQRGLADTPQAVYMRAWRAKQKAEGREA